MKQSTNQGTVKRNARKGLNLNYVKRAAFIGRGGKETEKQREEREERAEGILNNRRRENRSKGGNFAIRLKARRKANKVARASRRTNKLK